MDNPIRRVSLILYPNTTMFSGTTFQAAIYSSDNNKKDVYAYGGSPRALKKDIEYKIGEVLAKQWFPFLYGTQGHKIYGSPKDE